MTPLVLLVIVQQEIVAMILFLTVLGFCSAVSLMIYGLGEVFQKKKVGRGLIILNDKLKNLSFILKVRPGSLGTFLLENYFFMFQYFGSQISYFKSHFSTCKSPNLRVYPHD